jgi:hypothetical protein
MNTASRFARYFALPIVSAGMPGWRWHHGIHHLQDLQPGYTR